MHLKGQSSWTHLFFGLGFLDVVSANLDAGGENSPSKLHHVHPKQVAELLCNCGDKVPECSCLLRSQPWHISKGKLEKLKS